MRATLEMVQQMNRDRGEHGLADRWEPLLNNLGHCCRKNRKFEEALQFHRRALALQPLSAGTYTAIGFVQSLQGDLNGAIESLHRSLSIRRDDVFTATLLRNCIDEQIEVDAEHVEALFLDDEVSLFGNGSRRPTAKAAADLLSAPAADGVKLKLKFDDSVASVRSAVMHESSVDMSM